MKHIHSVFDLTRSHSLVLALSFFFSVFFFFFFFALHGRGEMNEKRGEVER